MRRELEIIQLVLFYLLVLAKFSSQSDVKSEFQIKDKAPGTLAIHATRTSATIKAVADSVNLNLMPATAEGSSNENKRSFNIAPKYSTLNNGGNSMIRSISQRTNKKASSQGKGKKVNKKITNIVRTDKKPKNMILEGLKKESRRRKEKRKKKKNPKKRRKTRPKKKISTKNKRRKSDLKIKAKHLVEIPQHKSHDVTGSKKTIPDKEMRVHGQSGNIHVHTDHNSTTVNSYAGKLEVYIKNPEHYATHHEARDALPDMKVTVKTEAYKKDKSSSPVVFHGPLRIIEDISGLKKSVIIPKQNATVSNANVLTKQKSIASV